MWNLGFQSKTKKELLRSWCRGRHYPNVVYKKENCYSYSVRVCRALNVRRVCSAVFPRCSIGKYFPEQTLIILKLPQFHFGSKQQIYNRSSSRHPKRGDLKGDLKLSLLQLLKSITLGFPCSNVSSASDSNAYCVVLVF